MLLVTKGSNNRLLLESQVWLVGTVTSASGIQLLKDKQQSTKDSLQRRWLPLQGSWLPRLTLSELRGARLLGPERLRARQLKIIVCLTAPQCQGSGAKETETCLENKPVYFASSSSRRSQTCMS